MSGPKSDKIWADAVRKAVHEYHSAKDADGKVKKTRKINLLAANLVEAGLRGEMPALKEIGDRLDGGRSSSVFVTANHQHTHKSEPVSATAEWITGLAGGVADSKDPDTRH